MGEFFLGFGGFFEGFVEGGGGGGAFDAEAVHEFADGAQLEFWVLLLVGFVGVKAGAGGFGFHGAGGGLERNQDSDGGFFAVEDAPEIADVFDAGLAAFDLDDDLLGFAGFGVVAEKDFAVNAVVGAFLLLDGARADETKRPPLELIFVFVGQFVGVGGRTRL